jgi:hypothetical protein
MRQSAICIAASVVVLTGPALGDEVHLQNGGRVRGTVIVADPEEGVRIKLANGDVKEIPQAEIARIEYDDEAGPSPSPSPRPDEADRRGTLTIDSDENGEVFARQPIAYGRRTKYGPSTRVGVVKARRPESLSVPAGPNLVVVEFDDGGYDGELLEVPAGGEAELEVHGLEHWHGGPRVWLGGVVPGAWITSAFGGAMFSAQAALTYRLSSVVALRGALRFGGGYLQIPLSNTAAVTFGAEGVLRFSLSSAYGMELGVDGGLFHALEAEVVGPAGFIGPRFSLMSLRFGAHRNSELALRNTIPIFLADGTDPVAGFAAELSFAVMLYGG